jgi:hypothetical protein
LPFVDVVDMTCATNDSEMRWFGLQDIYSKGVWYTLQGTGGTIQVSTCYPDLQFESALAVFCGTGSTTIDFLRLGMPDVTCEGRGAGAIASWCSELGRTYTVVIAAQFKGADSGPIGVRFDSLGPCPLADRCCRADIDFSGGLAVADIFAFSGLWFQGDLRADFNRDGVVTIQDYFDFLSAWFAGCN